SAYYYKQRLEQYKEMLNQPEQLMVEVIRLLQKIPVFQEFYKRNSVFSTLFRLPASDPNDPAYLQSLAGLQTRNQVSQLMQQRLGNNTTVNGQQQIDQL